MDPRLWRYWLGIPLAVTLLFLSGAGPGATLPASEAGPLLAEGDELVMEFWVEPDVIPPGECAMLMWGVEGPAALVFVDGQETEPVGEKEVCPKQTTAYELVAETAGRSHSRELVLYVGEEPEWQNSERLPVHFQVVEPEAIPRGACARLVWEVPPDINEDWPMFLDGEEVEHWGDKLICPEETTVYHLLIETPDGPQEYELPLQVVGDSMYREEPFGDEPMHGEPGMVESPIEFVAASDAIPAGECTTLVWQVPEGDWLVLIEGQEVPHSGQAEVCPDETRSYELIVEGMGEPKSATAIVHVEGSVPPEPGEPPQPTPPQPQPTSPQQQPGGGLEADVTPTDLYPDNQPQGTMWARITNNGPGILSNHKVEISGTGQATPISGGSGQTLSLAAKEYTLNLAPGQTQQINLGLPLDASKYAYDFNVIVKVKNFVDPNPANNGYQEKISGSSQPQPKPQPGGKGSDVAVTDLYPQNQPKGKIWARITNHGPEALSNAQVEMKCGGTGVDANGKTGWSHVESPKIKTINLKPGETVAIETDVSIDTDKYSYDLWCAAWPKSFTDPNQNNNKYSEKIAGSQPAPPPGGSSWGVVKADLHVTDLFPQNQPKGAVMMRVVNNGPMALSNVDVETTCTANIHGWTQGSPTSVAKQVFKINAGLNPGQQGEYYTGIDVDTQQHWYDITCSIKPPFNDPNTGNNSYQETIPPSP